MDKHDILYRAPRRFCSTSAPESRKNCEADRENRVSNLHLNLLVGFSNWHRIELQARSFSLRSLDQAMPPSDFAKTEPWNYTSNTIAARTSTDLNSSRVIAQPRWPCAMGHLLTLPCSAHRPESRPRL